MKTTDYLFLAIMAGVFMFFVLLIVYATFRAKDDKDKNDGDPSNSPSFPFNAVALGIVENAAIKILEA